jgi:expansin
MKKHMILLTMLAALNYLFAQVQCGKESIYQGEGTYYDIKLFGNFGNCSFPSTNFSPFLIGAMNRSQYGLADFCGACAEVTGPKGGKVIVTIIDQCPECKMGDIDLSPEAFDYLAPRIDGRIKISWKLVPCPLSSPVQLYIKEGSSQYWCAVQVRNHRNKIEKLEYWNGSAYVALPRQDFNYFLADKGLGVGPFKFRITDVYGNTIEEDNIPLSVTTVIQGKNQFPSCAVTSNSDEALQNLEFVNDQLLFVAEGQYQVMNILGVLVETGHAVAGQKLELPSGMHIVKFTNLKGISNTKRFVLK